MQQLRVVDLARTMGISPKELIFKLRSIGVSVSGEEDALDLSTVRSIITGETLQKRPREVIVRQEAREEESQTSTARDRMAKRRRRQVVQTEKEIREFAPPPVDETAEVEHADELPVVAADEPVPPVEVEPAEVAELPEGEEAAGAEELAAVAEAPFEGAGEAEAEVEEKPEFEITEEELTASRKAGEEASPLRVRPIRAKTPLEQGLRELTPDEIKESLEARKRAEQRRKVVKPGAGKKAKAAADAKEIRELLTKFEEQKLKGQQEGATPTRPGPRPGDRRPTKKARRRLQRD